MPLVQMESKRTLEVERTGKLLKSSCITTTFSLDIFILSYLLDYSYAKTRINLATISTSN